MIYGCIIFVLLQAPLACSLVPRGLKARSPTAGSGFLSKSILFVNRNTDAPKMNYITAIQQSQNTMNVISQFTVFDQGGLWFVNPKAHSVQWELSYMNSGSFGRPILVDVDGDGIREIVCRGGGFSDVALLDFAGNLLWKKSGSYKTELTANSMSVGDLDRNGTLEFYVAANDGLYSFDTDGQRIWQVGNADDMYRNVEVFDSEVASERQIVAKVQRRGRYQPQFFEFRDHQGNLLSRVITARHVNSFRLLRWPNDTGSLHILARNDSTVAILDSDGVVVWEYKIPGKFGSGHGVEGTFVRFSDEEDPYLAVLLGTKARYRRSILCVFTLDGNLVHQEVLGASTGLLAIRLDYMNKQGEVLLVGDGIGKVVCYQQKKTSD